VGKQQKLSEMIFGSTGDYYRRGQKKRADGTPNSAEETHRWAVPNNRENRGGETVGNSEMTAFAEFGLRCVLDCGCPLSSAEGGTFLGASQAGRSPVRAPQRRRQGGGRRGGGRPRPANFAQLLGERVPLGLPEGPNRPKSGSLWAAGGSEISSRRADRATT
jgi:hypothetical protein